MKSRSSSGERDDSFEIVSYDDDSDTESDSFIEVTVDEVNRLTTRREDEKMSVFNFPSRVLKYFNPIAADETEEVDEEICKRLIG